MEIEGQFLLPLIVSIVAAIFFSSFLFLKSLINNNTATSPIPNTNLNATTTTTTTPSKKSPSFTSTDLVGEYEVFLSFCGQDTRYGFTDFLYTSLQRTGIRTFRDNNELRVGEEIGPELLKAINDSKISIPIFSKNYASSKWCLLELAHMVQSQENGAQMIFPIFYDIDPHDVRHQSGSYEEAFCQYKNKHYNEKTVQGWKEALKKVGQLKGLELKKETDGHEGELVKIITDKVLEFLKQNIRHEDMDLVGMASRIEKMEELLSIHSDGVRVIGIHGMGGLGKTTIAEVIYCKYQHYFECHSFLKDVRETSKSRDGIVLLQNQLRSEILKTKISDITDYNEGIRKIKDAVHRKKVIIVLDDVDEKSQIDQLAGSYKWFGARSRIIITTRNEEVLRAIAQTCRIEGQPEVYESYKPELMDDDDSLELFSKHAFMSKSPPEGYDILSKKVVSTAAGLPLVLVVTGSSLFGEIDKDIWEEKFQELKNIAAEEVLKKLRLSFDPLRGAQKEIFLDIACLFIGQDKTNPCYMWHDCEFYPRNVLNVLVRRSLITVGDDNILRMHDQLRDLGRQIAREGKLDEWGRWSRLWHSDKALEVYMTGQGTENVKALCLGGYRHYYRCLVGEKFFRLPNLRYLTVNGAALVGDFGNCLPNVRWIEWRDCWLKFTPTNFHLRNLVILNLSYSDITNDWDLWSQIKMSKKLKVLDLSYCKLLRRVPFLSTFSNLERLLLYGCRELCNLDGIEEFESLRYLDVSFCKLLETLPNLSRLRKLKVFKVSYCELIIDIPGIDKLESLELLDMNCCKSLERLPDLSNLKMLKEFYAFGVMLTEIRGLGGMESLEVLDISYCKGIERLFDLSNLKRLRELKIRSCGKLIEIHGLEGSESLEHLDMWGCTSIENLPDLPNFGMLKDIDLTNCRNLHGVEGLRVVESLESLNMSYCNALGEIIDLRNLKNLKKLDIGNLMKLNEIQGLEELKSLELLDINGCELLEVLTDISNLTKLRVIRAAHCPKLTEIRGLEELKSLEFLDIGFCKSIESLPDFSNLKKLEEINATDCKKLTEIRGLEKLESFRFLYIRGCKSLKNLPYLQDSRIRKEYRNDELSKHLKSRWR